MEIPLSSDGFTRIPNEILEALCQAKIFGYDLRVLLALIRWLQDGERESDEPITVPLGRLSRMTGIDRRNVHRSIRRLAFRRIVTVTTSGNKKAMSYQIDRNSKNWRPPPTSRKPIFAASEDPESVIMGDDRSVIMGDDRLTTTLDNASVIMGDDRLDSVVNSKGKSVIMGDDRLDAGVKKSLAASKKGKSVIMGDDRLDVNVKGESVIMGDDRCAHTSRVHMTVLNNKSTLKNIKPKPQHLFLQRGAGDAPHTPISSKKKNPSKKDADVKAFIDHYHDTFVAKFGEKPVILGGKDGMTVKRLLGTHGLERLKELLTRYFDSDDPWIQERSGYTIVNFATQINRLLVAEHKAKRRTEMKPL